MIMLWGRLGTQRLAAANLAWTWIHFTMVIIEGAQQALYSLVPQAMGEAAGVHSAITATPVSPVKPEM